MLICRAAKTEKEKEFIVGSSEFLVPTGGYERAARIAANSKSSRKVCCRIKQPKRMADVRFSCLGDGWLIGIRFV